MGENIKGIDEYLEQLKESLGQLEEIIPLALEQFNIWLEYTAESLRSFWRFYLDTEHYKKQIKYKKRVANREKLYQKRIAKYGRF